MKKCIFDMILSIVDYLASLYIVPGTAAFLLATLVSLDCPSMIVACTSGLVSGLLWKTCRQLPTGLRRNQCKY